MRTRPYRFASLAPLLLAITASGCVYRMNIQQGNYLEPRAVEQLQLGMTRSQVRYLLGTPMIPDAFDSDRWDYLYYRKQGRLKSPEQRHLTVYFDGDKVARIDRHDEDSATASVANAGRSPP
jgi:outer membrane protein assembly factor BamE